MQKTHFSRIYDNTTWQDLQNTVKQQQLNGCTPIPYNILVEIPISTEEFDFFCNSLIKASKYFKRYATQSVIDSQGIWNCIVLKCATDSRNLILYTAGNHYPLYASIITSI